MATASWLVEFLLLVLNDTADLSLTSAPNSLIQSYPSKGVALHYHFAKLQLNSLALRGLSPTTDISIDRTEAANNAIVSAIAALKLLLYEPDVRESIIGVPLFKHTMFTFSAVFLLKACSQWNHHLHIDQVQAFDLVQNVVTLLRSASVNRKHLVYHIANGLGEAVRRFRARASLDAQPGEISLVATPANNADSPLMLANPQAPDLFDDFGIVDGLNLAANDWLLYGSLDTYSSYSHEPDSMIWNTNHDSSARPL